MQVSDANGALARPPEPRGCGSASVTGRRLGAPSCGPRSVLLPPLRPGHAAWLRGARAAWYACSCHCGRGRGGVLAAPGPQQRALVDAGSAICPAAATSP
jgi:hypothetical protein